ncbi:MAG: cation:proton antiporter, partial [Acaryochloridaceae cyanobacterium CSU_5_19]|nr:cation:proton antiporter [Acaryochloridaceae cyanobacterium CSU_5_19]
MTALPSLLLNWFFSPPPLLMVETKADEAPLILSGVLLSLVVIYCASKLGGEISRLLNLPPVLGELVGGVAIGASALHLLVFAENGMGAADSALMPILQFVGGSLSAESITSIFETQSEIIQVLSELGVI